MHVLNALVRDPTARLRDIADEVGITERAVHRIVTDLTEAGYLHLERVGTRNQYEVRRDMPLRHPLHSGRKLGEVLDVLEGRS